MIDGGHLRALAKRSHAHTPDFAYTPDFIVGFAQKCVDKDETLLRCLYYDCRPFNGRIRLPISGTEKTFTANDGWLRELAARDLMAVRLGQLRLRGFKRKPGTEHKGKAELVDEDFKPVFEQKGVDMRIGLDIANYAQMRSLDRIALVTGDTDCVPAMKHARKAGIQVIIVSLPGHHLHETLKEHADFVRQISW